MLFILPCVGGTLLDREFGERPDFSQTEILNDFGRIVGHFGSGDHFVALDVPN